MEKVITIPDNPDEYLFLTKGETKEEIPITFTKKNNNEYGMKLNPNKGIDDNLNNTLDVIKENEQNKSLFFIYKEDANSTMDYDYNPSLKKTYIQKKSSNGLSGGDIASIILTCIATLLAVLGFAFYLGKSSSGAVSSK